MCWLRVFRKGGSFCLADQLVCDLGEKNAAWKRLPS
jgi:hypothetical protein